MLTRRIVLATFVVAVAALVVQADGAEDKSITVFAAASMKNALDEVKIDWPLKFVTANWFLSQC